MNRYVYIIMLIMLMFVGAAFTLLYSKSKNRNFAQRHIALETVINGDSKIIYVPIDSDNSITVKENKEKGITGKTIPILDENVIQSEYPTHGMTSLRSPIKKVLFIGGGLINKDTGEQSTIDSEIWYSIVNNQVAAVGMKMADTIATMQRLMENVLSPTMFFIGIGILVLINGFIAYKSYQSGNDLAVLKQALSALGLK